ncbi:MAG: extracellular solute-binding protein family 5 [Solirubrobacterales bacterium]|nr:extracellular solute-binding protein family 5 [Solirubrobacterales bacterium]
MNARRTGLAPGRTTTLGLIAAATAGAVLLAGCGSGSKGNDGGGAARASVTMAIASNPSLDPAKAANQADAIALGGLYDTLVRLDARGEAVAGLASSWKATPTSVVFELRNDVTCSDGTKLTPSAVAASLKRLVDPATAAPFIGASFGPNKLTVTPDDAAGRVTVTTSGPWSQLLNGLAMPWTGIVCPAGLKDPKALATGSFGTGPYVLQSAAPGRRFTLRHRSNYTWGPKLGASEAGTPPKTLLLNVVANESTAVNMLVSDKLDIALLGGPDLKRLDGDSAFTVAQKDGGTVWLAFNQQGTSMKDEALRRGVAQAIDRAAFANAATFGRGKVVPSVVGPTIQCFDATAGDDVPKLDAGAARAALGKAGTVRIIGTTQLGGGAGQEYVQAALREVGVDAKLRNTDTATWSQTLTGGKGDWELSVVPALNPAGSIIIPISQTTGAGPPKGTNYGAAQNPQAAAALGKAVTQVGPKSCAAWGQVQHALNARLDVLPLSTLPLSIVSRKGVSVLSPQGGLPDLGSIRVQ